MDDRFQELERRLAQAEGAIVRLTEAASGSSQEVTTLTAPVRVVDASGRLLIELAGDTDGGYVHLRDPVGNLQITMGCSAEGGWLDVIQAGNGRPAVTLVATDEGGSIEITREDGCYLVQSERYYPSKEHPA
jgi:hypothetical protein